MTDIQKPDMTKLWANAGDKTPPADSLINSGWNAGDIPANTDFNFIDARQDQGVAYMLQKGIPEWDSATEYQANKSWVQYGGKVYKAIQTGVNKQPDTQFAYWEDYFLSASQLLSSAGAGKIGFSVEEAYNTGTVGDSLSDFNKIAAGGSKSFAEATYQTNAAIGGTLKIACYGDSLTYGFDTQSTTGDLQAGINGSADTRALYQYPEALGAALQKAGYVVDIQNRGYPGDTSSDGLTRWQSADASDIAILMYGTNDSLPVSGQPKVSMQQYKQNMIQMILREQEKGAFVILLTPPRLRQANLTGAVLQRQQWMRNCESTLIQLGQHFGIPVISVDEIVRHRVDDIYSDDTHFNKWGYNLWGWNLSAAIIQRSVNPTEFAVGSVMTAAGGSMQGLQSLLDGKTVMVTTSSSPIVVSGYFKESVIACVRLKYNSTLGGSQRVQILLNGGTRGQSVPRSKIAFSSGKNYAIGFSEPIHAGYRTFTIEVASSTTTAYVDKIEFLPVEGGLVRDSLRGVMKQSKLTGLVLQSATDANRFIFDESILLRGDFRVFAELGIQPSAGQNAGVSLLRNVSLSNGQPDTFVSVLRLTDNRAFVRIADPAFTDFTTAGVVFSGAVSTIEIERLGDVYTIFADGVQIHSFTKSNVGDLNIGVARNNAAITCNFIGMVW